MTTTTNYGSWCTRADRNNATIWGSVADCINGGDAEWRDRVESSGALDRMVSDYRDAINDALPSGVSLCGDEFIGPYYEADCDWDGDLDIGEIIAGVDLAAIVDRHDPDSAEA